MLLKLGCRSKQTAGVLSRTAIRSGSYLWLYSSDQQVIVLPTNRSSAKREHTATIMTDPLPDEANVPAAPQTPKGLGLVGKIVLWAIAAIVLVPIIAVVGTYLSIFFIGYNR